VCFINGLPIVVIELKNPAVEQADIWSAFNQLQTYKDEITELFVYNEALVISDGLNARVGSLTADRERFLPWRTLRNENDRPLLEFELEKVVRGFLAPDLLLDYLRYFILFEQSDGGIIKKIAAYHQFHAVREAVEATLVAATQPKADTVTEERATYGPMVLPGSRKGGIVWHTQGSGKSISMVCFAAKLMQRPEMQNPTLVVITDRNDLDGQLFQTFVGAHSLLRELPQQAEDREQLRTLLDRRPSGGIIFSTVQKFTPEKDEDRFPMLTDRTNIVVIADEAHRSQYGFRAVLDKKSGKYKYGFAKHLRDALPFATFVGFTGTPVQRDDKDTRAVFGDYVSIYDIQDAVDDGATVPIY
jgi:type I restriction enzyme R subunit